MWMTHLELIEIGSQNKTQGHPLTIGILIHLGESGAQWDMGHSETTLPAPLSLNQFEAPSIVRKT